MRQRVNLRSPLFLQYESRLAEVESENLQVRSEEFDNAAWGKTRITVTSNQVEAPDGTLTADKLECNTTGGSSSVTDSFSITAGDTITSSVFFKKGNSDYFSFGFLDSSYGSGYRVTYDLNNNNVTYNVAFGSEFSNESYNIENYGGGWYRASATATSSTTTTIRNFIYAVTDGGSTFAATQGEYNYFWGFQSEIQEQATSYIKTEGTTVTRAATTEAQEEDVTAELRIYSGGGGYDYERTNYALNNTQLHLNSTLTNSGSTITKTGNFALAPDGTLTATRLQASGTSGYALLSVNGTDPLNDDIGGGYYRSSVYVKSNTGSTQTIAFYGSSTQGSLSHEIGNEWKIIDFLGYRPALAKYAYLGLHIANGSDTDLDFLVWGGQTELNDLPVTSFIPTEATAVTELAYQTEAPAQATYTLTKSPENGKTTFEIAELIRDYIEQTTTKSSGTIWADVKLSDNLQIDRNYQFLATEGYIDNTEGLQTYLNAPSNETFMQSNSTVFIPEGQELEIPVYAQNNSYYVTTRGGAQRPPVYFSNLDDNSNQIEYVTLESEDDALGLYVNSTVVAKINVIRTECSKYANNILMFVNKFGAKQDFFVNMKSTERFKVKDDGFSRSVIDYSTLSVNKGIHSYKRRVLESKESYSLNTPFLDEENVQAFEELLLSEYVWLKKEGADYIPVVVKDMSMTRRTHLNDKLIQYTVEVESANHLVNIQR